MLHACAGVILLSEDLHRVAYNAAYEHFQVRCNGQGDIAHWWGPGASLSSPAAKVCMLIMQ